MLARSVLIIFIATACWAPAMAAEFDDLGPPINIMKPEPGTPAAKKKSSSAPAAKTKAEPDKARAKSQRKARGSSNPVYPTPLPGPQQPAAIPHIDTAKPRTRTPPELVVPQTGRVLPNTPSIGTGRETFHDKSIRCINQAGTLGGGLTGNRDSYIRTCINQ